MSDLRELKEEMALQAEKKKQEFIKDEERKLAMEESFQNKLKDVDALELTLTSYDDFKSFIQRSAFSSNIDGLSDSQKEVKFLHSSQYPWVKFSAGGWALPIQYGNHLRIYKVKKKGKITHENSTGAYTLKLYRKIPYMNENLGVKFVPRTIISSVDLLQIIGKVEELFKELHRKELPDRVTPVKNYTKFAKWRTQPATVKQQSFIKKKLLNEFNKHQEIFQGISHLDIERYVDSLSKGNGSNILFAISIAPVYPIRALLQALKYKKAPQ